MKNERHAVRHPACFGYSCICDCGGIRKLCGHHKHQPRQMDQPCQQHARCRCKEDERNLIICITEKGEALKERAASIPGDMTCRFVNLSEEEIRSMYHSL